MNLLKSAIGKLRAVEAVSGDKGELCLWRGMKNLRVTDDWLVTGGTDSATMSTTSDLGVAVQYSISTESLLFKIKTKSFMQRGADLTYISAFPGESELVYPPLTFLQPTGHRLRYESTEGDAFTVVEVEPYVG